MVQQYYIDNNGAKDGPHDLLTIMRRIRAEKIGPDTLIFVDDAADSKPANQIHDIALFFTRTPAQLGPETHKQEPAGKVSMHDVLQESWRFTYDNNIMTVFAGGLVLLAIMLAAGLVSSMGAAIGGMLSWIVFVILHYIFFIFILRIYRMQPFSADFINRQFAPVLPILLFAGIVLALMMIGGFFLLVIPGILVAVYYIFAPFFIYDRRMSLVEAMYASRLLVQKHNRRYQRMFSMLVLMYIGCLILIFPIPVALPMFAVTLARVYEELSIS